MSFSGDIKRELANQRSSSRHCQIAEITAIISMCGGVTVSGRERFRLKIQTENLSVARKYFTLLTKTFNIVVETSIRQYKGKKKARIYEVTVKNHEDALQILKATRMLKGGGETYMDLEEDFNLSDSEVIRRTCCKRAFLRGAFLVTGSVSDPNKFYHLEFACSSMYKAEQIRRVLKAFDLDAKIVQRKKYYVVYLKEGDRIVDVLNVIEAHQSLMELENIRILKDMRNLLNRQVNLETANITKTVNAAVKQIEDIRYIQETIGFEELGKGLAEMAEVRLANPHAPLSELGMLLTPQVGKSGVNHRLRKLSEIAEDLRAHKEERTL